MRAPFRVLSGVIDSEGPISPLRLAPAGAGRVTDRSLDLSVSEQSGNRPTRGCLFIYSFLLKQIQFKPASGRNPGQLIPFEYRIVCSIMTRKLEMISSDSDIQKYYDFHTKSSGSICDG